eukprot:GFYU01002129.1.p1 GENE.GFYU01002129.1~~GFYU01002129.1.p1  ORF type:complete len:353 (-),score=113.68 GFYU01002129.1:98-1156(-)
MLWVDQHRPTSLEKLDFHDSLSTKLKNLAKTADIPHMIFYGPSGSGKKTRVSCLLRELYGPGVDKLRIEVQTFKPKGTTVTVELTTIQSNYHIEMNPSDCGNHDRFVVQEQIKQIASNQTLETASGVSFKVVVLHEVDKLTKSAQHALRRTMEKYVSSCRLILCCNNPCKVIEAIRSRCLLMRVPAPSKTEVVSVLKNVANKENLKLPETFANNISDSSDRNLRRAVLLLESSKAAQYPFSADQQPELADWERFIGELAKEICEEQSPSRLLVARGKLYELLANCIPADLILRKLTKELLKKVDDDLKHEITTWAAHYENRLQNGSKPIFHLEAFIAKFMSIYKGWMMAMFG